MKFGFIARHRAVWPVQVLCEVLEVSRSGFYEWLGRRPSGRSVANERLLGLIRQSFESSDRTYGSRRVWRDVLGWGESCGIHRVARLMSKAGLAARRKRRRLPSDTGVRAEHCIAPNLLQREFEADAPNRKWLADFTYVWTDEGWLYVAVVLDLYSRRIVGWSMKEQMTAQLVVDALVMAVWRRGMPRELLQHSDQGSQGEFNPSSQHIMHGGDDGCEEGAGRPCEDEVARAAARSASGRTPPVLAGDCRGTFERRGSPNRRRVAGGRNQMVSGARGHAAITSFAVVAAGDKAVLVAGRARADCAVAGPGARSTRDRAATDPLRVDDFTRAAPQRLHQKRRLLVSGNHGTVARRSRSATSEASQTGRQC